MGHRLPTTGGLESASKYLKDLGVPEPEMPPFKESEFERSPEVEIDPQPGSNGRASK